MQTSTTPATPALHIRPLDPFDFLERSAAIYRDKLAVIDGDERRTYPELLARVERFAAALQARGITGGERVAVLSPNASAALEAAFAVPRAGGVLCALNIRLSPSEIDDILQHCGAELLVYDLELQPLVDRLTTPVARIACGRSDSAYESIVRDPAVGAPVRRAVAVNEDDTISINYTSGTTGRPKGVMYTYRGAYLNALAEIFHAGLRPESVYLWTLPMFHCNGWCFPWAVTAAGATHYCLRRVEPARIIDAIAREGVTHLCAAPTVLVGLCNAPGVAPFAHPVHVTTAGAPPAPTTIAQMEALGARIDHVYGLTETYGPITECAWQSPQWDDTDGERRARRRARQGVPMVTLGARDVRVVDPTMADVPADGRTQGEIVMRGNNVMKGYYRDEEATRKAFAGGYFHSGDVAVMHPDGYIEIVDRAKDVIISGGENISTVQVEQILIAHPAVMECAVIGVPDDTWGEVPKAFVALKPGAAAGVGELQAFARERIAAFKVPKHIEFGDLPKTSTGKIQKFVLREREWAGQTRRVH